MSKATERKLGDLHGAVAEVLLAQVTREEEETTFDADGNMVPTGDMVYSASPAVLATAIKFLKDNSITCEIEVDKNMNGLKEALSKRQKHSRLVGAAEAAQSLDLQH